MPSELVLEKKKAAVAALTEQFKAACVGVVVDYKGISVADDTALRKELREAGVKYTVVKNSLLTFAAKNAGLDGLEEVFAGTTAIATSEDDYAAGARILCKYAEEHENFKIKGGFMDGAVVALSTIEALSKLPTKEVLLATVLSAFNAPIASFARAVQAIVDKNGEGEAAAE